MVRCKLIIAAGTIQESRTGKEKLCWFLASFQVDAPSLHPLRHPLHLHPAGRGTVRLARATMLDSSLKSFSVYSPYLMHR